MRKPKILFLSTGDATRSQIAGAFLRRMVGEAFDVVSTAVKFDALHPLTNDVMKEVGIDMSGEVSKSIKESFNDAFMCVITICDAAKERHPVFPFARRLVHWSIPDPAESGLEVLRRVRDEIKEQVSRFTAEIARTREVPVSAPKELARAS